MRAERSLGSANEMVATPWGTSESLRERMLRPGPGNRAEEVAENQRQRIFGAMVASVAERGYTATRVSDLVELSGVSSRTFYDLFADKQSCFLATIEAVLALATETAVAADAEAAKQSQSWEERAVSGLRTFAEMIASQPAAARVVLIEAYAAGPEVLKPLDDAAAGFERLAQQTISASPERVGMPPEMMTAHVGALQEITRNRLRHGTTDELPGLMESVAEVVLSYRPPPEPLRLTTRSPAARPEDLDAHNHAERALRALAVVIAEKGYAQTTVDEVIARASMSATTFYANFSGKEDALMAAIDSAGAQVVAAVMPAFERSSDWPSGIRAAFGALFSFLATRPALAHLISVGVYGAGLPATERRARALAPLSVMLERGGATRQPRLPAIALEVIAGAAYGLTYRQVRQSGPESLPALAPTCTYLALAPFIGAEDACAAANGDGLPRSIHREAIRAVGADATMSRVLDVISKNTSISAEMISSEIDLPVEAVAHYIGELENAGIVEALEERSNGGVIERRYRSNMKRHDEEAWESTPQPEREQISSQIGYLIKAEWDDAVEAGSFDARTSRHLSRLAFVVDEQGWHELAEISDGALDAAIKVQDASAERLKQSGEQGVDGRMVQLVFEMPGREKEES